MQLKIAGIIIAEGSETELALYTHALLEIFRLKHEMEQAETEKQQADFERRILRALFHKEEDDD